MAKKIPWVERIGETKQVIDKDGNIYNFEMIDVIKTRTGNKVQMKVNGNVFDELISKSTWEKGVFRDVIKKITPDPYIGQVKMVRGLTLETIQRIGKKLAVMVTGTDNITGKEVEYIAEDVTENVWNRGVFQKLFRKIGLGIVKAVRNRTKKINRKAQQATKVAKKLLLLPAPQEIDYVEILRTTYDLKELKNAYRGASKKFHPDMGGNVNKFKLANLIYGIRKIAIQDAIETEGVDSEWFEDEVDLNERILKRQQEVAY